MRRAVFLDRDGVLNEVTVREGKPYPPASRQEVRVVKGALEALQKLQTVGFLLIVVTNQPDVARRAARLEDVEAINCFLQKQLPLDAFYTCYHDDVDKCMCRKPLPGLLLQATKAYDITLAASFMIGDRWRDISAGSAAGVRTIWIDQEYTEKKPAHYDFRARTLPEAVAWILSQIG